MSIMFIIKVHPEGDPEIEREGQVSEAIDHISPCKDWPYRDITQASCSIEIILVVCLIWPLFTGRHQQHRVCTIIRFIIPSKSSNENLLPNMYFTITHTLCNATNNWKIIARLNWWKTCTMFIKAPQYRRFQEDSIDGHHLQFHPWRLWCQLACEYGLCP